jgi:hypothetical protein
MLSGRSPRLRRSTQTATVPRIIESLARSVAAVPVDVVRTVGVAGELRSVGSAEPKALC